MPHTTIATLRNSIHNRAPQAVPIYFQVSHKKLGRNLSAPGGHFLGAVTHIQAEHTVYTIQRSSNVKDSSA
jgi:hypothetical protein